ncbi:MAG: type 1 glutamine amidotransferase [Pseudomonadota bacterium]
MKPIRIFQHEDWIPPGRLTQILDAQDTPFELVCIDHGDKVPRALDDVSGLVFLGGTMSVNDDLPWLADEMDLIRHASARDVPMLGHCLGSQLIAKAFGATVAPMPHREIGWWDVTKCDNPETEAWLQGVPATSEALLWHKEAFTLPENTVPLCSTDYCPEQGFTRGNTVATIAHFEVTADILDYWLNAEASDFEPPAPSIQTMAEIREEMPERCARMHAAFTDALYEAWLARVRAYEEARENAPA